MSSRPEDFRLVTLDPGHFHAALLQKEMIPGIAPQVEVFAPFGKDLLAHLNRVLQFNLRPEHPTSWQLDIYAGPDYWDQFRQHHRGNVVVLSGINRGKIDRIEALAGMGLHVLADKPWIIELADLPKLRQALDIAAQKGVVAYDAMTQRFEISCLLQKELVNDPEVFGICQSGTLKAPAVYLESVHYLCKEVAGVVNLRPAWFFDIRQQGEGLADAGTHLADLVQWILFPEQAIEYQRDIQVSSGSHWPTRLSRADFNRVTGEPDFPDYLRACLEDDHLDYMCNNQVDYLIRNIHARLVVRWEFEAKPGIKDTELAIFRGTKASIEVRQGQQESFVPEVYVVSNPDSDPAVIEQALRRKITALQSGYPGLDVQKVKGELRLVMPSSFRVGHEAHFALLTQRFMEYLRHPQTLPAWEAPNMVAKYYVTTQGVALARKP